jgi:hypothetical protein
MSLSLLLTLLFLSPSMPIPLFRRCSGSHLRYHTHQKKAKDKQEIDENDALESGILMKAPPGQLTAHVCVCLCVYRSGYVYLRTYMH